MAEFRVQMVQAFTGRRAAGNPAGVLVLDAPLEPATMQAVSKAVGASETAFLWPEADAWRLRWFTPKKEIVLCGHATLASAFVLWASNRLAQNGAARFDTLSGRLQATKDGPWIELDFPRLGTEPLPVPPALEKALGAKPIHAQRGATKWILEMADEGTVRDLDPDFAALDGVDPKRGFGVTARGSGAFDYVCRFFAPYVGVHEDPATGSIQCALHPYWSKKLGRNELSAFQSSAAGGVFRVRGEGDRVFIAGRASAAATVVVPV